MHSADKRNAYGANRCDKRRHIECDLNASHAIVILKGQKVLTLHG
jgi:hypothetical protein